MNDLTITALCLLCVALGVVIGMSVQAAAMRRRERLEAPEPALDMEYDLSNPINARGLQRGETDPETGLTRIW